MVIASPNDTTSSRGTRCNREIDVDGEQFRPSQLKLLQSTQIVAVGRHDIPACREQAHKHRQVLALSGNVQGTASATVGDIGPTMQTQPAI